MLEKRGYVVMDENTPLKRKRQTKKQKSPLWKKILIFLAFELVFSAITMPLLVFYGPFDNLKKNIVGMSWNTLSHQWIAKMFMSDRAIYKLVNTEASIESAELGEKMQDLKFTVSNDNKIEVKDIQGDISAKLMIVHNPRKIQLMYSSKLKTDKNANSNEVVAGEKTSDMAKRNKAIGGINAGGFKDISAGGNNWTGTGGLPMGFIIHNGELVYNEYADSVRQETVAFDDRGMLIVGKYSVNELKDKNVKEAVSFGPTLIVNGKKSALPYWGPQPRTAIGQRKDGAVLLLVVDGRSIKNMGASLNTIQDILYKNGAVNAANLDGGSSTTMYYKGKVINRPSDNLGERTVATSFIVMP